MRVEKKFMIPSVLFFVTVYLAPVAWSAELDLCGIIKSAEVVQALGQD